MVLGGDTPLAITLGDPVPDLFFLVCHSSSYGWFYPPNARPMTTIPTVMMAMQYVVVPVAPDDNHAR
jgi:hypothetical protein